MGIKVSIIIPIYNVEKYITKCIESVINQTYENIEIICVDDCGSDNSINIVEQYKDKRIKIIKHECNKGLAVARNTGIKNSTGDYIYFLDSDDHIHKDTILDLLNTAVENNADFSFANIQVIEENGFCFKRTKYLIKALSFKPEKRSFYINKDNFLFFLEKMQSTAWNKLYKKSFLIDNNIFFIKKNIPREDEGFFVKIMVNFPKISYIDKNTYYYLIRKSSIVDKEDKITSSYKNILYLRTVLDDALDYIKNNNKDLSLIKLIKKKSYYIPSFRYRRSFLRAIRQKIFRIRIRKDEIIIVLFGIKIYEKQS